MVRPGISVLLDERAELLRGKRVGVYTNHTGVLPDLTHTIEALAAQADLRAIWGPEHGLDGVAAEGALVEDAKTLAGVPIWSLYGDQLEPTAEQLATVDLIVCDIQDVGCRFYTYVWTMTTLIAAAAKAGVSVIVADRPNPLGGASAGPGVEPGYRTLVGLHDVPVRHGLTIGELARVVNAEQGYGCDLTVVPCAGWRRDMRWAETGLPWVSPSPNMPTLDTATVYPGTCLLEGVNVSVGRGSARPFEWQGAPWIDGVALARHLNALELPGVRWRPNAFTPCSGPYAGEVCRGAQPHVTDAAALEPVTMGVALVLGLRATHPEAFAISAAGSIYADAAEMARRRYPAQAVWNTAHFDRLAGSSRLREQIEAGATLAEITAPWAAYGADWERRAAAFRLYP